MLKARLSVLAFSASMLVGVSSAQAQDNSTQTYTAEEYKQIQEEAAKIRIFQGVSDPSYDGRPTTGGYQIELFEQPIDAAQLQSNPETVTPAVGSVKRHSVKKGETLYAISKAYNVSLDDLRKTNNIEGNNIGIGQELLIPSSMQRTISALPSARPLTVVRTVEPIPFTGVYAVLPGDTLFGISRRACVSVEDITATNALRDTNLQPGQRLQMPAGHCLK